MMTLRLFILLPVLTNAFQTPAQTMPSISSTSALKSTAAEAERTDKSHLYVPSKRDAHYQGDVARYLLDLDGEGATFDFCGGMMFQLSLSNKLKSHLQSIASTTNNDKQPKLHPSSQSLMARIPNYQKSSYADNISTFHGRELRRVPNANGGMGFVLQLSYSDPTTYTDNATNDGKAVDPEGWSTEEITTYDGWRGDTFRKWRNAETYTSEGFGDFKTKFGPEAYGLNHRFYLHLDNGGKMWLSAEDGCEGTPRENGNLFGRIGDMLFGK